MTPNRDRSKMQATPINSLMPLGEEESSESRRPQDWSNASRVNAGLEMSMAYTHRYYNDVVNSG